MKPRVRTDRPESAALSAAVARLQTPACETCLCILGRARRSVESTDISRVTVVSPATLLESSAWRSSMAALRRFTTSPRRLNCANSGHSPTAWRRGQIGPFRIFPSGRRDRRGWQSASAWRGTTRLAALWWNLRKMSRISLRPTSTRRFLAVSVVLASLNCSLLALNKMRLSVDNAFICR